jgi:hypothetical protein
VVEKVVSGDEIFERRLHVASCACSVVRRVSHSCPAKARARGSLTLRLRV